MATSGPVRPITLIDAIALIAATACGLAVVRPALLTLSPLPPGFAEGIAETSIFYLMLFGSAPLAFCSIASLALALRRPRPSLLRLARHPGFMANTSAVGGIAATTVYRAIECCCIGQSEPMHYMQQLTMIPGDVGYSVVGAFLVLAIQKRVSPRPLWTDRLGFMLGLLWIFMMLLTWIRMFFILWRQA